VVERDKALNEEMYENLLAEIENEEAREVVKEDKVPEKMSEVGSDNNVMPQNEDVKDRSYLEQQKAVNDEMYESLLVAIENEETGAVGKQEKAQETTGIPATDGLEELMDEGMELYVLFSMHGHTSGKGGDISRDRIREIHMEAENIHLEQRLHTVQMVPTPRDGMRKEDLILAYAEIQGSEPPQPSEPSCAIFDVLECDATGIVRLKSWLGFLSGLKQKTEQISAGLSCGKEYVRCLLWTLQEGLKLLKIKPLDMPRGGQIKTWYKFRTSQGECIIKYHLRFLCP